ncbi:retroviral-like aspartic protease family protein [Flavobacteriaceae bacterium]|nr:retroviral-like aspartic protease family protein [Flavobacteriaceae bacterium]MDB4299198.1 retroviral-like aspartic protease family protein [Flavobacteriaceae bacterium]
MQLRNLLEGKDFQRIVLRKMTTGHYTCKVKLNTKRGIFIIDTGASSSCIAFEYVAYFNLIQEESDVIAAGAGDSNMKTALAPNNVLELKNHISKNMPFVLFDLSHVKKAISMVDPTIVHGILGADYLKKHSAVIDYGRNCMYLK